MTGSPMTASGTPSYQQTGAVNYGVVFTAADGDYFSVAEPWDQGTSDMTVSVWFNTTLAGANQAFCGSYGTYPRWWIRGTDASSPAPISCHWHDGSNSYTITSTTLCGNSTIYNVVMTVDRDGYLAMFIDGVAQADSVDISASSAVNMTWASPFYIGRLGTGVFPYTGMIDEIGIWSSRKSPAEIYNSGSGTTYPFE